MIAKTPWAKQSKENEKIIAEHKLYLANLTKKAGLCLNDPKFADYVAMFKQYEAQTVSDILAINEIDPVIYAFKVRQLVDTLKAYRLLISAVDEDVSRKVQ